MREEQPELCPAKVEAQTHSRTSAERDQVLLEVLALVAFPAARFEDIRLWEGIGIPMDEPGAAANHSLRGCQWEHKVGLESTYATGYMVSINYAALSWYDSR